MKPYFQDDWVTIYHGDCREVMPGMKAQLIVADPPYEETGLKWDKWPEGWLDVAAGVANSIWCFGSLRMFLAKRDEFRAWKLSQDIIWEKHNGSGLHADRFRKVHEIASHFYQGSWADVYHQPVYRHDATKRTIRRKGKPEHWGKLKEGVNVFKSEDGGPRMERSVIYCRGAHGSAIHPTEKPMGILRPLIQYACPIRGGVEVVDCFMGSASTLRTCRELGIKSIGIEGDEAMCEKAVNSLAQAPLALF